MTAPHFLSGAVVEGRHLYSVPVRAARKGQCRGGKTDSNRRLAEYLSAALPYELLPQISPLCALRGDLASSYPEGTCPGFRERLHYRYIIRQQSFATQIPKYIRTGHIRPDSLGRFSASSSLAGKEDSTKEERRVQDQKLALCAPPSFFSRNRAVCSPLTGLEPATTPQRLWPLYLLSYKGV